MLLLLNNKGVKVKLSKETCKNLINEDEKIRYKTKFFKRYNRGIKTKNTGIGLTVVKKIVELYGGGLRIETEIGKGSTFYFTLPTEESKLCIKQD